jgi:hypothetical protein
VAHFQLIGASTVYNSLLGGASPTIVPWDETTPTSASAISSGSTGSQTWYTNGSVSSKSFRILGYVESTQATAGTWASAPTKIALFGPGVKRPGDVVQEVSTTVAGPATTGSASFVALSGMNVAIPLASAANLIRAEAYGSLNNSSVASLGTTSNVRLSRGMTANTNLFGNGSQAGSSATATIILGTGALTGYDLPNVSGSVTYAVQGSISNGGTLNFNTVQISAREIQI